MAKKSKAIPAKPAAKAAAPVKETGTALVVPVLKPAAMSVDVGPVVLAAIGAFTRAEREIGELRRRAQQTQYEAPERMTAGIVKAAKTHNSIRREQVFTGHTASKARMNNKIYLAIG